MMKNNLFMMIVVYCDTVLETISSFKDIQVAAGAYIIIFIN